MDPPAVSQRTQERGGSARFSAAAADRSLYLEGVTGCPSSLTSVAFAGSYFRPAAKAKACSSRSVMFAFTPSTPPRDHGTHWSCRASFRPGFQPDPSVVSVVTGAAAPFTQARAVPAARSSWKSTAHGGGPGV